MLNDIIVVDNAVADPDRLRQLALVQQTYTCRDHEQIPGSWTGLQTNQLILEEGDDYFNLMNEIWNSAMSQTFGNTDPTISYNWHGKMWFQFMDEECVPDPTWFQRDEGAVYSGLLYLNPEPPKDSGDLIIRGQDCSTVDNHYNRLVIYRSDYMHTPQGGFGKTVKDSRLILRFKIVRFSLKVSEAGGVLLD
jgi:hypothetical protein